MARIRSKKFARQSHDEQEEKEEPPPPLSRRGPPFLALVIFSFCAATFLYWRGKVDVLFDSILNNRNPQEQQQTQQQQFQMQPPVIQHPRSSIESSPNATEIVERAYERTYKHIVDHCGSVPLVECLTELHNKKTNYPWWFETLLRDGSRGNPSGLHGGWHHQVLNTPSKGKVEVCSIEKIASSEVKLLKCALEGEVEVGKPCRKSPDERLADNEPHAVFLRDPLERFVSAFVDKCIKHRLEAHCEPHGIYSPTDDTGQPGQPLIEELVTHNSLLFDAYVDTFPLKWNVHFMPLSLYCNGLYRTIKNYDFVGYMDKNYNDNLQAFGKRFSIEEAVAQIFHLKPSNGTTTATKTMPGLGKPNRNATASRKVREFYTPRTLRRVLEYLSIDYSVHGLALPLPAWVDDILAEEER